MAKQYLYIRRHARGIGMILSARVPFGQCLHAASETARVLPPVACLPLKMN